jgi:hypothetical protein
MKNSNLNDLLKKIHEETSEVFEKSITATDKVFESDNLQIIAVSYSLTTESVGFWDLYAIDNKGIKIEDKIEYLRKISIRNGEGTVGFIVRSMNPEMVGDTFGDPRGAVSFEDYFIENESFLGIPVKDNNELKFIISFSYNETGMWPESNSESGKMLIPKIQSIIEKHSKMLLLLNELHVSKKTQNVFVHETSDNLSLLNKMLRVVDESVSYSFMIYSQNGQIVQIKINDSIIENNIFSFLNWCSLFKNKCDNCFLINASVDNISCKYYKDFLQYLKPYQVLDIPLDKDNYFVLRLYYSGDPIEIAFFLDRFQELFKNIINIFKETEINDVKNKDIKEKALSEVIHQIINHYINFDSQSYDLPFDKYSEIIKKRAGKEVNFNKTEFDETFKVLIDENKDRLLLFELWRNKINGIQIISINKGEKKCFDPVKSLELDQNFKEPGTINVLIKPDLIPKEEKDKKNTNYKPLITAGENDFIYRCDNSYVIEKMGEKEYVISWQENAALSQLIRIKINPVLIEKVLETNLQANIWKSIRKNNQFIGFETKESFGNKDTEISMELGMAINHEIQKDTRDVLDQFAKNIYQSELKQIANTRATIARIINRNYSHSIGSHVSLRSTFDEIYRRVVGKQIRDMVLPKENANELVRSIVLMENKLTRYKDERNDFISGIEDNIYPVTFNFYQDIILPFIENSLLLDNLAKSENVFWKTIDGKMILDGKSKLRIRVFYEKNLKSELTECKSNEFIIPSEFAHCSCTDPNTDQSNKGLSLKDLEVDDKWIEILALYDNLWIYHLDKIDEDITRCSHELPYLKYINKRADGVFYNKRQLSTKDIAVSMPGSLGAHSIYSLLENLIRNTAKHAARKLLTEAQNLDIIIKISIPEDETEKDDFYDIEFTTNIPSIKDDDDLKKLRKKLREELNDKCRSLGFADMRINATLLRFNEFTQRNLDESISLEKYPTNSSDSYALSVNLKLSKPHKVILIGERFNAYESIENKRQGIWYFKTVKDSIKRLKERKRTFEFAILDPEIFEGLSMAANQSVDSHPDLLFHYLPWRILVPYEGKKNVKYKTLQILEKQRRLVCSYDLCLSNPQTGNTLDVNELLSVCWKKWMQERWGGNFKLNFFFADDEKLEQNFIQDSEKLPELYKPTVIQAEISIIESKRYIFYDRHGTYGINHYQSENSEKKNLFSNKSFFSEHSWIHLDKNNLDFDIINSWTPGSIEDDLCFMAQLAESGMHRILIVDERATQIGNKDALHSNQWGDEISDQWGDEISKTGKQYFMEAAAGGVYIADSFLIDNTEILHDTVKPLFQITSVNSGIEITSDIIDSVTFDTLIIHRTIFGKLYEKRNFKELHWKNIGEKFPNILICTGGGTLDYDDVVMKRIRKISYTTVHKLLLNGNLAKNCLTKYL